MKKKLTAICLCVALLAIAIVGATLAYFTDTKSATNTFTVGNVKIDLIESRYHRQGSGSSGDTSIPAPDPDRERHEVCRQRRYDFHQMTRSRRMPRTTSTTSAKRGKNMVPGKNIAKSPYVINTGANDAYIRIRVMIPSDANRDYWQARSGGVIESQFCTTAITSGEFMHNDKTTYNPFIDASAAGAMWIRTA